MTLVVAVGNPDQFVQVSDRRLVSMTDSGVLAEESNKAFILCSDDARLIGGYSGLASCGPFKTRDWILDTLYECADTDCIAENIFLRFKDRATQKFRSPGLQTQSLSVMFSGWHYDYDPPLAFQVIISNHLGPDNIYKSIGVQGGFQYLMRAHHQSCDATYLLNSWIGMPFKMSKRDKKDLKRLILERKPAYAIKNKLFAVVSRYSKIGASRGTVGGQLSSIILPRSRDGDVLFDYQSTVVKPERYAPDILFLTSGGRQMLKDLEQSPENASVVPPLTVPKVKTNAPCPCGSGQRYGRCHGRKKAGGVPFSITLGPRIPPE